MRDLVLRMSTSSEISASEFLSSLLEVLYEGKRQKSVKMT